MKRSDQHSSNSSKKKKKSSYSSYLLNSINALLYNSNHHISCCHYLSNCPPCKQASLQPSPSYWAQHRKDRQTPIKDTAVLVLVTCSRSTWQFHFLQSCHFTNSRHYKACMCIFCERARQTMFNYSRGNYQANTVKFQQGAQNKMLSSCLLKSRNYCKSASESNC